MGLIIRGVGTTSSRLRDWCARLPRVARCLATLGFVAESLWDSCSDDGFKSSEGASREVRPSSGGASLDLRQLLDGYDALSIKRCGARGRRSLRGIFSPTHQPGRIPKGFWPPAQGCEQRATLGSIRVCASIPKELCHYREQHHAPIPICRLHSSHFLD